ncbi:hypothetical protein CHH27_22635 [Labrenzia sp. VG12]|nr:hypothetical protein CHH27_22635 [Labrenzia sp. VG12]
MAALKGSATKEGFTLCWRRPLTRLGLTVVFKKPLQEGREVTQAVYLGRRASKLEMATLT